jgi:hypothetical protein
MGGDAGLVTFDQADPDKMNAEVYRCQPLATPAVPPAGAPGDPTSIHRMLLGTWSGTLSTPPPAVGGGWQHRTQFPAIVRVWEEGGQLRGAGPDRPHPLAPEAALAPGTRSGPSARHRPRW